MRGFRWEGKKEEWSGGVMVSDTSVDQKFGWWVWCDLSLRAKNLDLSVVGDYRGKIPIFIEVVHSKTRVLLQGFGPRARATADGRYRRCLYLWSSLFARLPRCAGEAALCESGSLKVRDTSKGESYKSFWKRSRSTKAGRRKKIRENGAENKIREAGTMRVEEKLGCGCCTTVINSIST